MFKQDNENIYLLCNVPATKKEITKNKKANGYIIFVWEIT